MSIPRLAWIGILILLAGLAPVGESSASIAGGAELSRLRAERRAAMRTSLAGAEKSAAASFGLLVIPVDFSDARLPDGWQAASLAPRLTAGSGESLQHYFTTASGGRLDLRIVVAPPVHLQGVRRDYSDVGLNLFTRTRRLAAESIGAVADLGFDLGAVDNDGSDGRPGTADDDGQVDGVLILHAAPGQENDPENGLIQALQYFLDEPVVRDGVEASFYAVASLSSGPGIWAHEVGHLLGMEDRYDPLLPVAAGGDLQSRGGLGRFSLMAAGAWGTGGGWGAALPDAYTCWQMGWCEVDEIGFAPDRTDTLRPLVAGGAPARIWRDGERGTEFYLLEARDPAAAAPFDAGLPEDGLLIYHVDESVPEFHWSDDGPGLYHLRARLVEADADDRLRDGDDTGTAGDVFPGSTGAMVFGAATIPSSYGYGGPSGVELAGIARVPDGVVLRAGHALSMAYDAEFSVPGESVRIVLRSRGLAPAAPRLNLTVVEGGEWGAFDGGATSVDLDLIEDADGAWVPDAAPSWFPAPGVPADACTRFRLEITDGGAVFRTDRQWCWNANAGVLDFADSWPGDWTVTHPGDDDGTTWTRWEGSGLRGDGGAVLACTGRDADPASWPEISYTNGGQATLTSGALGPGVDAVRIVHHLDAEFFDAYTGFDGGVVRWVGPDGGIVTVAPVTGWPGRILARADTPLHGSEGFVGRGDMGPDQAPIWRASVFAVPEGTGPWRLQLAFAADALYRGRGWFVASIEALAGEAETHAFIARVDQWVDWQWPFEPPVDGLFDIEIRTSPGDEWQGLDSWSGATKRDSPPPYLSQTFGLGPGDRAEIRVVGAAAPGKVASAPVVVQRAAADSGAMTRPWPNPANGGVRFSLEMSRPGAVSAYDVRGRLVWRQAYAAGQWLVNWDAADAAGRRLPSGTYFLRLEGSGRPIVHKVVLVH